MLASRLPEGRLLAAASPIPAAPAAPRPLLRPADAVAIIVGIVIGAGIYKTPSMVAGVTGDGGWVIVARGLGAVVSLAGALFCAELATAYRTLAALRRLVCLPWRSTGLFRAAILARNGAQQ